MKLLLLRKMFKHVAQCLAQGCSKTLSSSLFLPPETWSYCSLDSQTQEFRSPISDMEASLVLVPLEPCPLRSSFCLP